MRKRSVLFLVFCVVAAVQVWAAKNVPIEGKTLDRIAHPASPGTHVTLHEFDLVGREVTLELKAFDVWADDAVIRVYREGGEFDELPPERRTYFGGSVVGDRESFVFLSVGADVRGLIIAGDVKYVIGTHASRLAKGRPQVYVEEVDVYANMEIESGWKCDADELGLIEVMAETEAEIKAQSMTLGAPFVTGSARYQLGVYVETDHELYVKFGNTTALSNWIGDLVAASTVMYDRDLITVLKLAGAGIYTTSSDPFSDSTSNFTLLKELGNLWHNDAGRAAIARSATMLLSGKTTGGGVAWVGTICSNDFLCVTNVNCGDPPETTPYYGGAYGMLGSVNNTAIPDPNGSPSNSNYWALVAFAHELGHIVNSRHTHCITLTPADQTTYGRTHVDQCYSGECYVGAATVPAEKGTIMSYCHLETGGATNLRYLFGLAGEASEAVITSAATYNSASTVRGRLDLRSPDPSAITAPSIMSAGSSANASITPLGGVTYEWTVTNGSINSGQGTNSINFTAAAHFVTVKVVVRNSATIACSATDSVNIEVTGGTGAVRGDFNGDGRSVLTWRNQQIFDTHLWMMNGTVIGSGGVLPFAGSDWKRMGTGDLNGDGKEDLIWRHSSGEAHAWFMDGASLSGGAVLPGIGTDWTLAGIGDFNGDGKADLIWSHVTGETHLWLMNGGVIASGAVLPVNANQWSLEVTGDFNGDGKADLIWRNKTTHEAHMWFMNGASIDGGGVLPFAGSEWSLAASGDFNGNGVDDLIWRYTPTGETHMWFMNGASIAGGVVLPGLSTAWKLVDVGDYNGDGTFDLVWRFTTGEAHMWLMNNGSISSGAVLPGISSVWTTTMEGLD